MKRSEALEIIKDILFHEYGYIANLEVVSNKLLSNLEIRGVVDKTEDRNWDNETE